ncbi:MAG: DNA polymerase IV, partial [Syntrophaceae bacterium]|nr:DNA polymerase IV [Syntrophaceae bacterium]
DEAFADITGMRRALRSSYEGIAHRIKDEIARELGITVSVGLSVTKVLAKVASKYRKPDGLTLIPGRAVAFYLQDLPVEGIWGIGPATTHYLHKMGIRTALEFARLPEELVRRRFTKPGIEIWHELRGESIYPVTAEEKSVYASISKGKTFAPPTSDRAYLFAHLLRNCESACLKARHYRLSPRRIAAILKKQNFEILAGEVRLSRPSSYPIELTEALRRLFDHLYMGTDLYRATEVILLDLAPTAPVQCSLFEDPLKVEKMEKLYGAVDELAGRLGKHMLHLGGSHAIEVYGRGRRGHPTVREETRFYGETKRRHLGLPILHVKV